MLGSGTLPLLSMMGVIIMTIMILYKESDLFIASNEYEKDQAALTGAMMTRQPSSSFSSLPPAPPTIWNLSKKEDGKLVEARIDDRIRVSVPETMEGEYWLASQKGSSLELSEPWTRAKNGDNVIEYVATDAGSSVVEFALYRKGEPEMVEYFEIDVMVGGVQSIMGFPTIYELGSDASEASIIMKEKERIVLALPQTSGYRWRLRSIVGEENVWIEKDFVYPSKIHGEKVFEICAHSHQVGEAVLVMEEMPVITTTSPPPLSRRRYMIYIEVVARRPDVYHIHHVPGRDAEIKTVTVSKGSVMHLSFDGKKIKGIYPCMWRLDRQEGKSVFMGGVWTFTERQSTKKEDASKEEKDGTFQQTFKAYQVGLSRCEFTYQCGKSLPRMRFTLFVNVVD